MEKWKILFWVLAGFGGVLVTAAEVSPEDAVSNLSGWVKYLGLSDAPEWLATDSADMWGTIIGVLVVLISLAMILTRKEKPNLERSKTPRPAPAIKIAGGKGITVTRNISVGQGPLLDAENVEDLNAEGNIKVDSIKSTEQRTTKAAERDVWLLDAVFYVAEGRWQSPNMLAQNVADIEDSNFMNKVEPAHREILQKALDGELPIWGKRVDQNRGPYIKIERKYWESHELEYWDMAKGKFDELETAAIGIAQGPIYTELRTSRYRVEELWPKKNIENLIAQSTLTQKDWSIRDALEWWEAPPNRSLEENGMKFFDTLEQLALDGVITVWGRPNALHNPLEKIDPSYWKDSRFDTSRYIHLDSEEKIRETSTHPKISSRVSDIKYYDLRLTSEEVKQHWPPENT